MLIDIFSFGETVLGFVVPVFNLFKEDGFAPFLAFAMVVFTALLAGGIYIFCILPGKKSLQKVLAVVNQIDSQNDFTARYNEIDTALTNTPTLKHGWEEFGETLIKPDQQSQTPIFKNTIRPSFYLNTHEVEAELNLTILHFTSNLLVGIGLLLTFVGLVAALTFATCGISDHVSGALAGICTHSDKGNQLDAAIKDLLHAASLKFWTSVSGLGCSMVLRMFYEWHHRSIKSDLKKINAGIERGLQFITPEFLAIENLREVQEQTAAIKRFSQDLALSLADKIQTGFETALSPVNQSLKDIGDRITGGIGDAIKDSAGSEMQQLAQNMSDIVESLNVTKGQLDGIGNAFQKSITEAAEALKAASGVASSDMSQKMQDVMTTLAEESRKQAQMIEESIVRQSSFMDKATVVAGKTVNQAADNLASGMNGVSDGVRDAASTMAERMTQLSGVLKTIEERMNTHVQTMDALTNRARDTEQAMGATSRHLSEAAQPVAQATTKMATAAEQLNLSIQNAQKSISESHKNLGELANKMAETQQVLQNAWKAHEARFIGVDESLAKAMQGIIENVRDNIESMGKFVGDVDKKLGAAVVAFSQNISELNDTAESFEDAASKLLTATDRISGQG
jgi:ABC-type transporter Mla subunit MlaD